MASDNVEISFDQNVLRIKNHQNMQNNNNKNIAPRQVPSRFLSQ